MRVTEISDWEDPMPDEDTSLHAVCFDRANDMVRALNKLNCLQVMDVSVAWGTLAGRYGEGQHLTTKKCMIFYFDENLVVPLDVEDEPYSPYIAWNIYFKSQNCPWRFRGDYPSDPYRISLREAATEDQGVDLA